VGLERWASHVAHVAGCPGINQTHTLMPQPALVSSAPLRAALAALPATTCGAWGGNAAAAKEVSLLAMRDRAIGYWRRVHSAAPGGGVAASALGTVARTGTPVTGTLRGWAQAAEAFRFEAPANAAADASVSGPPPARPVVATRPGGMPGSPAGMSSSTTPQSLPRGAPAPNGPSVDPIVATGTASRGSWQAPAVNQSVSSPPAATPTTTTGTGKPPSSASTSSLPASSASAQGRNTASDSNSRTGSPAANDAAAAGLPKPAETAQGTHVSPSVTGTCAACQKTRPLVGLIRCGHVLWCALCAGRSAGAGRPCSACNASIDDVLELQTVGAAADPPEPRAASEGGIMPSLSGTCATCQRMRPLVALVPCGHVLWCALCAGRAVGAGRPCTACNAPIDDVLELQAP
jgi:hypothetical protein